MTTGTGGVGAGLLRAAVRSEKSPWWWLASPRWLTSLRSSPPTPAPSTRRPGASWLIEASWRAVPRAGKPGARSSATSRDRQRFRVLLYHIGPQILRFTSAGLGEQ